MEILLIGAKSNTQNKIMTQQTFTKFIQLIVNTEEKFLITEEEGTALVMQFKSSNPRKQSLLINFIDNIDTSGYIMH